MQQQVRMDQALQQQQHASTVSADAAGGDGSGHQPDGEQLYDGSGPPGGAGGTGAAPASNGSMQQVQQQQQHDLSGAQHAGYYYGYDTSAPGLPQQYWGPSAYPTGYPPPGWSPSMPSK